jgi:hypothetical protein
LISHLYANANQKIVPNSAASIQATIDAEIRKYQAVLDKIDIEIQMSKMVIDGALAERRKRSGGSNSAVPEDSKVKGETSVSKENTDDIEELAKQDDIAGFDDLPAADSFGDDLDLIMKVVGDNEAGGDDLNSLFSDSFNMMMPN